MDLIARLFGPKLILNELPTSSVSSLLVCSDRESMVLSNSNILQHTPTITRDTADVLHNKAYIMLYFGAQFATPCHNYEHRLEGFYHHAIKGRADWVLIFVSQDHNAHDFLVGFSGRPWFAVPFDTGAKYRERLKNHCRVSGIPTLVVLTAELTIVNYQAKYKITEDPDMQKFPWRETHIFEYLSKDIAYLAMKPRTTLHASGGNNQQQQQLDSSSSMTAALFHDKTFTINELFEEPNAVGIFFYTCNSLATNTYCEFLQRAAAIKSAEGVCAEFFVVILDAPSHESFSQQIAQNLHWPNCNIVPYRHQLNGVLLRLFGISNGPRLVMLRGNDGKVLNSDVSIRQAEHEVHNFPWRGHKPTPTRGAVGIAAGDNSMSGAQAHGSSEDAGNDIIARSGSNPRRVATASGGHVVASQYTHSHSPTAGSRGAVINDSVAGTDDPVRQHPRAGIPAHELRHGPSVDVTSSSTTQGEANSTISREHITALFPAHSPRHGHTRGLLHGGAARAQSQQGGASHNLLLHANSGYDGGEVEDLQQGLLQLYGVENAGTPNSVNNAISPPNMETPPPQHQAMSPNNAQAMGRGTPSTHSGTGTASGGGGGGGNSSLPGRRLHVLHNHHRHHHQQQHPHEITQPGIAEEYNRANTYAVGGVGGATHNAPPASADVEAVQQQTSPSPNRALSQPQQQQQQRQSQHQPPPQLAPQLGGSPTGSGTQTAGSVIPIPIYPGHGVEATPQFVITATVASPSNTNAGNNAAAGAEPGLLTPGTVVRHWQITSRIGGGAFGETYAADGAVPENKGKKFCIKVEKLDKRLVLRLEVVALKKAQTCPQVVRYISSGRLQDLNFLVMECLGENLADLRRRCPGGIMDLFTSTHLALSSLKGIEGTHGEGILHRDIKPSNFVVGLHGSEQRHTYLIDFGLARKFLDSNNEVKPPRPNAGFRGTSRYASIQSHRQCELGRVDDLWSWYFMIVEFLTGTLPWRKTRVKEQIGEIKEQTLNPDLASNLPTDYAVEHYTLILNHLLSLTYYDKPNYELIRVNLERVLEMTGVPVDTPFFWESGAANSRTSSLLRLSSTNVQQQQQPPNYVTPPAAVSNIVEQADDDKEGDGDERCESGQTSQHAESPQIAGSSAGYVRSPSTMILASAVPRTGASMTRSRTRDVSPQLSPHAAATAQQQQSGSPNRNQYPSVPPQRQAGSVLNGGEREEDGRINCDESNNSDRFPDPLPLVTASKQRGGVQENVPQASSQQRSPALRIEGAGGGGAVAKDGYRAPSVPMPGQEQNLRGDSASPRVMNPNDRDNRQQQKRRGGEEGDPQSQSSTVTSDDDFRRRKGTTVIALPPRNASDYGNTAGMGASGAIAVHNRTAGEDVPPFGRGRKFANMEHIADAQDTARGMTKMHFSQQSPLGGPREMAASVSENGSQSPNVPYLHTQPSLQRQSSAGNIPTTVADDPRKLSSAQRKMSADEERRRSSYAVDGDFFESDGEDDEGGVGRGSATRKRQSSSKQRTGKNKGQLSTPEEAQIVHVVPPPGTAATHGEIKGEDNEPGALIVTKRSIGVVPRHTWQERPGEENDDDEEEPEDDGSTNSRGGTDHDFDSPLEGRRQGKRKATQARKSKKTKLGKGRKNRDRDGEGPDGACGCCTIM